MIDPLRVAIAVFVVLLVFIGIVGVLSLSAAVRMKRLRDASKADDIRQRRPWW